MNLTSKEAAERLDWSYDYTRKQLVKYCTPVKTIGKNKMWSHHDVDSLRSADKPIPVQAKTERPRRTGQSRMQQFLETYDERSVDAV